METLSFSRILFTLGLALGLMVLWVAAAPSATDTDSLFGGTGHWDPYSGCACCDDVTMLDCTRGSAFRCVGPDFVGLVWGTEHTGQPNGLPACREPGGEFECQNLYDSKCDDSCTME